MAEFFIELSAGLVGVFAGAALALWMDRRARRHRAALEQEKREQEEVAQY